ncbi:MAG: hypothetical protein AAF986_05565 [Pseudomonadota bacterium]
MRPMSEAPRNKPIQLFLPGGKTVVADYYDCEWLREGPDGDETIADCWTVVGIPHDPAVDNIELDEPLGWLPLDDEIAKEV